MRKGFILIAAAVMTAALSVPVFAGSWQGSNESGWKWQRDNGSYASSGWEWCDGDNDGLAECYYFNAQGICLQNTTTPDGFTVNADGAWADDGWIQRKNVDGGGWETGAWNSVGRYHEFYYRGRTGKRITNQWRKSGDYLFHLGSDGALERNVTVWSWGKLYFASEDGAMVYNSKIPFDLNGQIVWIEFGPDGAALNGSEALAGLKPATSDYKYSVWGSIWL